MTRNPNGSSMTEGKMSVGASCGVWGTSELMAATMAPMSVTLPSWVIMPAPEEDEENRVNGGDSGAALK